ncbi:hypothetical protein [Brevundimonas pondensis]|uniref:Scaffolding protein n=1 Tax=Brevundimonas pondensis TaxID=2774189 RepID=A0ABX7SM42_9CAUL|nr:hypothetical protein [Brevundimonas pondensis]QTC88103.1 hypothetical protein IFE19_01460 [Brevundimonas pondensis]
MTDTSTSQETGITEAQAAERLLSHYQSEDHGPQDETGADEPQPEEEDAEATEAEADDPEGEPDADPEETPEGEQDTSQTFKVKVDGEELDVPLDELLKGYSREQVFTRRMQALAEDKKSTDAERQTLAETRTQYSSRLEALNEVLKASEPRVDQSLRQSNPAEWSAQMLQHREWAEQARVVEAEQSRLSEETAHEEANARADYVKQEGELLLAALPEWKDAAVAKAEQTALVEYGRSIGLSQDEIDNIADHRVVVALRKAMLFDQLKAKAPDTRAKVDQVKTARPGPKTPPSRATETKAARDRLAAEGSTDAAARLILMKQSRRA